MPDDDSASCSNNLVTDISTIRVKRHGLMAAASVLLSLFVMTSLLSELAKRSSTVDNLSLSVSALKQELADSVIRGDVVDDVRKMLDNEKNKLQSARNYYVGGDEENIPSYIKDLYKNEGVFGSFLYLMFVGIGSFLAHDTALAFTMILAGYVGCAVGMFRQNRQASIAETTIGMASGFIVFLSIKGGHGLILISVSQEMPRLNPYGCTLVALMVGLFTDKAYQVLSAMADDFLARLRQHHNVDQVSNRNDNETK